MSNRTKRSQARSRIRKPLSLAVAAAMAATLSACTTLGPEFQTPKTEAPAQWSYAVPASPLPAERWTVFQDAQLLKLQALAEDANPDIKTAALHLAQSRVYETTVSAQRGPNVNLDGAAARQRQSESGAATRVAGALGGANSQHVVDALSQPFSQYQAGFDASWEPDFWGRVARSEEAASAGSDAQQALLRNARLSVAAEIARQYFLLRSLQTQVRILDQELALAREVENTLAAQNAGGLVDESALTRQRSAVASLAAAQPGVATAVLQAMNRITVLCGAKPGDLKSELAAVDGDQMPAPTLPDLAVGLPSELARHRPDVAAAEANLHAATADIGVAMADLYPRIVLGASFGSETVDADKFGDWGSRHWSVGPSLSIPVFDRGRRRSMVTLRELQAQEAAVAYQQAVLKAWQEVDDAIGNYRNEGLSTARLAEKLRLAESDAGLARTRYDNGLVSYLPLASAELSVLDARRDLAQHRAQRYIALAALYKALGDEGKPSAPTTP